VSFDATQCGYVVEPFPDGHLLTDPEIPEQLELIRDCSSVELPTLFPEPLCVVISTSTSDIRFENPTAPTNKFGIARIAVAKASEECNFNLILDLNPPCISVGGGGQVNYVPFSEGPSAELLVTDVFNGISASLWDRCEAGLFLNLNLPTQPCPQLEIGTVDFAVLPPDETPVFAVTVTKVYENDSDSINNTGCIFNADFNLEVPCTGVDVEGSGINFPSGGSSTPRGSLRVATISAVPCNLQFQILLDLENIYFAPTLNPAIVDLCVDEDGKVKSVQVAYYEWPGGDVVHRIWRSQLGYCDENPCFSVPLDYGLHNTGADSNNQALSDSCLNDSHWTVASSPAKSMAVAQYPALWMRPGRRSRWIAETCDGLKNEDEIVTFKTTFNLPSEVTPGNYAIEGILVCDNWVTDVRVNGVSVDIPGLTDAYPGLNDFELRGPMYRFLLKANFISGLNQIEFEVTNGGPGVSWVGIRIEWTGVGICGVATTTSTTTTTTSTSTTSTSSTTPGPTRPPGSNICVCADGETLGSSIRVEWDFASQCLASAFRPHPGFIPGNYFAWFPDMDTLQTTSYCAAPIVQNYNYVRRVVSTPPWAIWDPIGECLPCWYGPDLFYYGSLNNCVPPSGSTQYYFANRPSEVAPLLLCEWTVNMRMWRQIAATAGGVFYNPPLLTIGQPESWTFRLRACPQVYIMPKQACYNYNSTGSYFNPIAIAIRYTLTFQRNAGPFNIYGAMGEQLPQIFINSGGGHIPQVLPYNCRTFSTYNNIIPGTILDPATETHFFYNNFAGPVPYASGYLYTDRTDIDCDGSLTVTFPVQPNTGQLGSSLNMCTVGTARVFFRP
jgi:hypothetical protein